jgi:hypothetical protein
MTKFRLIIMCIVSLNAYFNDACTICSLSLKLFTDASVTRLKGVFMRNG